MLKVLDQPHAKKPKGPKVKPVTGPKMEPEVAAFIAGRPIIAEGFKLTERQIEAINLLGNDQRHTMLAGGARSTKTFTVVRTIVNRACQAPGSRHGIFRFRANAVWDSIGKDTLPKVMRLCFPLVNFTGPHKEGYFIVGDGSEIWLGGLDEKARIDKILGKEFATLFFNEVSQIPYDSVVVALTRLAQVVKKKDGRELVQRAYYDLNPPGRGHWTNVLFIEKRDPITRLALTPDSEFFDAKYLFMHPKDNAENLSPAYLKSLANLPERKRKRFYDGVYGEEGDGVLWTYEMIDRCRVTPDQVPEMRVIVVAVDPSGAKDAIEEGHDEIGIIVFGLGTNGHGYVFHDLSLLEGPNGWGKVAVGAYHAHKADHVVGEVNYGGGMVSFVIQTVDPNVPFKEVTASRGKHVRAEPVAALYEQGMIHHVGRFDKLEDEQVAFTTMGYIGQGSPNRADALVWAATDVMLDDHAAAWIAQMAAELERGNAALATEKSDLDRLPYQVARPKPPAQGNELTDLYLKAINATQDSGPMCKRCQKPVTENRITDGIDMWHPGCYP
jgi:hypothetical protein